MARLATAAPIIGIVDGGSQNRTSEGEGFYTAGTIPTAAYDRVRTTGLPVFKAVGSSSYVTWSGTEINFTLGRSYWVRFYFQVDTLPTGTPVKILQLTGLTTNVGIRINSSGQLILENDAASTVATSSAISVDTWFRVDLRFKLDAAPTTSNGELEFWLDNSQVANLTGQNLGTTNWSQLAIGWVQQPGLGAAWWTDVAFNDDQGANENSRPLEGIVRHCLPVNDVTLNNWVNGGGGTSNIYTAIDNVPPVGVDAASATNGSQIKNSVSSANNAYEVECQDYETAGVPSNHNITLVTGIVRVATNDRTGTNAGTLRVYSNPDVGSAKSFDYDQVTTVAGTEPTGWWSIKCAYAYSPSVTRSTRPRVRVEKTTANTRTNMVDYLAVVVESTPSNTSPVADATRQFDYSVIAPVSDATRQFLYDVLATGEGPVADATRDFPYQIHQNAGYPSPDLYPAPTLWPSPAAQSAVGDSTRAFSYKIKVSVLDSEREFDYYLFSRVSDSTRQFLYTLKARVTPSTRQFRYLVGNWTVGGLSERIICIVDENAFLKIVPVEDSSSICIVSEAVHASLQIQYNVHVSAAVDTRTISAEIAE